MEAAGIEPATRKVTGPRSYPRLRPHCAGCYLSFLDGLESVFEAESGDNNHSRPYLYYNLIDASMSVNLRKYYQPHIAAYLFHQVSIHQPFADHPCNNVPHLIYGVLFPEVLTASKFRYVAV